MVEVPTGFFFSERMLNLFGLEDEVVAIGTTYLRILFLSQIPWASWLLISAAMRGSGDTVTPMKLQVFQKSIHLALSPFLIFGWWVFPRLGVSGAAVANVIEYTSGVALSLWVFFSGRTRLQLSFNNFRIDYNIIWRLVKIGIPASIMGVQRALGNLILSGFVAYFGTLAVAAHSIVQRLEMFLFLPGQALGITAGVLVGQNLGARQPERAERGGWLAVSLAEGFLLTCSVAILLWAENIVGIFNTEPAMVELTSTFLRIAVVSYLVMGLVSTLQQCISGAGDTFIPMVVSLVMAWVVLLPLAFVLPRVTNLGVYGIRWAMVASIVVGAIAYAIYFRLGRWKHKRV